jgi:hypothetical protein
VSAEPRSFEFLVFDAFENELAEDACCYRFTAPA